VSTTDNALSILCSTKVMKRIATRLFLAVIAMLSTIARPSSSSTMSDLDFALSAAFRGDVNAALEAVNAVNSPVEEDALLRLRCVSLLQVVLNRPFQAVASLNLARKVRNNGQRGGCPGLQDLFFSSAVTLMRLRDEVQFQGIECDEHVAIAAELQDLGLPDEAVSHLESAHANSLNRESQCSHTPGAITVHSALFCPHYFHSRDDVTRWRARIETKIANATALCHAGHLRLETADLSSYSMPGTFDVAYMGRNDRNLSISVGRLYACLHPPLHRSLVPITAITRNPKENKLVRVGFLSAHFRRHSVCKLWCGAISRLPREHFSVYVIMSSDNGADGWTAGVGQDATVVRVANGAPEASVAIAALQLDVLVIPAIGMHQSTYLWASQRLARMQVMSWGHPVTSGLPSIDYFVSSDLFEPQDDLDRYSEQLVRFESTGFVFPWPDSDIDAVLASNVSVPGLDSALASIRGGMTQGPPLVVAVPQALMKLHPDFDQVLASVLRGHPRSVLVFLYDSAKPQHVTWRQRLEKRLAFLVKDEGMTKRVVFLERLQPTQFLAFLRAAAVVLDPFPFGGGVTTLEGFAVCAPIVSAPSLQTVPRLAAGMYRRMGLNSTPPSPPHDNEHLKRNSADGLADAALALLWNETARASLMDDICKRRHVLFNDDESILEWSKWLQNVAKTE